MRSDTVEYGEKIDASRDVTTRSSRVRKNQAKSLSKAPPSAPEKSKVRSHWCSPPTRGNARFSRTSLDSTGGINISH
jgi:hypothetical protein